MLARCGHVGRNKYIKKWFYIKAGSGTEAAKSVRMKPRVKHDHKYAIIETREIEYKEYVNGIKIMKEDEYFKIHNSSDQKLYNYMKQEEIYPEEKEIKYKKNRNGQRIKNMAQEKEWKKMIQKGIFEYE